MTIAQTIRKVERQETNVRRLIAVDCDGTLFDDSGYPSDRTCDVVRRVVENGHQIIAATGRSRFSLSKRIASLPAIEYAVCSNGAYAWDMRQDALMWYTEIPAHLVTEIVKRLRGVFADVAFNWESRDGFGSDEPFLQLAGGIDGLETGGRAGKLCEEGLYKIKVRHPTVLLDELHRELCLALGDSLCEITTSGAPFIELTALGVHKASALEKVAGQLGFCSEDTIVFGDNHNDLAMFKWAGHCVAMGNAVDTIKQNATAVTLSNAEHGVAHYLERLLDAKTL